MRVISIKKLKDFWQKHADSEQALKSWYAEAKKSDWQKPNDIAIEYPSVSFISNNRVVFNIKGNKFRLICVIKYDFKIVYIRFIGTHADYDKINAEEI